MKKLIRLWVMTQINHTEEYVIGSLKSAGINHKQLTHNQIAAYKATLKCIEADLMIELAYDKHKTRLNEIDISAITKPAN